MQPNRVISRIFDKENMRGITGSFDIWPKDENYKIVFWIQMSKRDYSREMDCLSEQLEAIQKKLVKP